MAYTYDDFLKDYQNSGFIGQMSHDYVQLAKTNPEFGRKILDSMRLERQGNLTGSQLQDQREYRNMLYQNATGGAGTITPDSGSGSDGIKPDSSSNKFSYTRQGEYDAALKDYLKFLSSPYDPASYDPAKDPAMAQYRKMYLREANRAQQDTLGQLATATGGIPSSYAVGASQQAGDYLRSQMMDKVPQLQSQAYNQYLQGITQKGNALAALSSDKADAYKLWLNEREYEDEQEKDKQLALAEEAEAKAKLGDFSLYGQIYGLTPEQVQQLEDAYAQELWMSVTAQETENTAAFMEKMEGLGLTPEQAKGRGLTTAQYLAQIEAYLETANLTDAEYKFLAQLYGLI